MATILAKDIVDRAAVLLHDTANVRWSRANLLNWLNDGQREIVVLRPDAGAVTENHVLTAGSRQVLREGAIRLFDVVRNMGADGTTPGPVVRVVERDELDDVNPNWMSAASANDIARYTFDGRDPTVFRCYPGGTTGRRVEVVFQANPVNATINGVSGGVVDSVISLNDVYQTALLEYLLQRAYGADTDARDGAKAGSHYTMFLQRLGLKVAADRAFNPHRNAEPRTSKRDAGGDSGPAL